MATRAVKLKLIVPRGSDPKAVTGRLALWTLHEATNRAVAFYEERLLEMRQGDVCLVNEDDEEFVRPAAEWSQALRRRLLARGVSREHLVEAAAALRVLYGELVKSFVESNSGSSQDAAKWHGALCSEVSQAGEQKFAILDRWGWLVATSDPPDDWRERIEDDRAALIAFRLTGSPPAWRRRLSDDDESWKEALLEDLRRKKAEAEGDVVRRLRELKALPLFVPVIQLESGRGELNTFERNALALAVAHLNQWESWRHRGEARRAALEQRISDADRRGEGFSDVLAKLKDFERVRSKTIAEAGFWSENSAYRITAREIRGWDKVRDWLRENRNASSEDRAEKLRELQRNGWRDFGAYEVLQWLVAPSQQDLVEHAAGDPVRWLVARNSLFLRLEAARSVPRFTFADARLHPRFVDLDAPQNSNKPVYRLRIDDSGRIQATIPGLVPLGDRYMEKAIQLTLARSSQVVGAKLVATGRRGESRLAFRAQDGIETVDAKLGGGAVIFERSEIERGNGSDFGRAYLKLALDHDGYREQLKANEKLARYFKGAVVTRRKNKEQRKDVRVLGVDLGLRSAAACAVYSWAASEADPCHERSFLLFLPGERPDVAEEQRRREASKALADAGRALNDLRDLGRLIRVADRGERAKRLERMREEGEGYSRPLPESADLRELREAWISAEISAGKLIHELVALHRAQRSRRGLFPVGGKSAWRLEHLDRTLRLLRGWDRRQHPDDAEVKRFDRSRAGTVARRLFEHLNALRDDRVKTTADLIVQSARGRVYRDGRWEQRFPVVNVIVLEDLSRYRFSTDRPRHENSQLMRWSHRALAEEVRMQAECYGIVVDDSPPEFSSRFDSTTGVAGVRCHRLSRNDIATLRDDGEEHWLARRLLGLGLLSSVPGTGLGGERTTGLLSLTDLLALAPGAFLPTGDGEYLVFAKRGGGLSVKHADINAAQNIALRYLRAFSEPIRIVAFETRSSSEAQLARSGLGKRLQHWFGGPLAVFDREGDGIVGRGVRSQSVFRRLVGGELMTEEDLVEDLDDAALNEELRESLSNRQVLFREPGGASFDPRKWYEQRAFWGRVNRVIFSRLARSDWRVEAVPNSPLKFSHAQRGL